MTAQGDRGFLPAVLGPLRVWMVGVCFVAGPTLLSARGIAAPSDDESAVQELSHDTAHAALIAEPLRKAEDALRRAKDMDRAGDTAHARLARALAHEWSRVAIDLIRAAAFEDKARTTEQALDELDTKTVRGRALLEETAARRGRAKEALEQLERQQPPKAPPGTGRGAKPAVKAAPGGSEHD